MKLQLFALIALSFTFVAATLSPPSAAAVKAKLLSRRRRYVSFPDGASASAALCLTIGVLGNPNVSYLSWAVNWGLAYDLPNYTWAKEHWHGFKTDPKLNKATLQRRSRRELYDKIAVAIDSMGFNGPACISRALCESAKYLQLSRGASRGNMLEEIVRSVFSLPWQQVQAHEPPPVHHYDRVYRRARREVRDCSDIYGACHFSLLELALGKYSVPLTKQIAPAYNFM